MAKNTNRGGARVGAGRKSKAEEQQLAERLSEYADVAHNKLKLAVIAGERWAVELFFGYLYGKPTQRQEISGPQGGAIKTENVKDMTSSEAIELAKHVLRFKDGANG